MAAASARRRVLDEFRVAGVSLAAGALDALAKAVGEAAEPDARLADILAALDARHADVEVVSAELAGELLEQLVGLDGGAEGAGGEDALTVIDAFAVPKYTYDTVHKSFSLVSKRLALHAGPAAKGALYQERFNLLRQRLLRNPVFNRPALRYGSVARDYCELTQLQALLGTAGETRYVMGALSQLEDGRFFLEDLTANVQVDLSHAETTAGLFTENCVVVAEGALRKDQVFEVRVLGFPPVEQRDASAVAWSGVDFFGGGLVGDDKRARLEELEAQSAHEMFIVASDVWLDRAETLHQLRAVLEGFDSVGVAPGLIVLMGDFCSQPYGPAAPSLAALRGGLAALGDLLAEFPTVAAHSRLVLVPGPGDPNPSTALPYPALPETLRRELTERCPGANVTFASNPCRVRFCTQELVFFRQDLQMRMRSMCVRPPVDDDAPPGADAGMQDVDADAAPEGEETPEARRLRHLAATLVQQAHLCPLPLTAQPVYWEYDHALALYPVPHLMVLADRSAQQAETIFEGCRAVNPGCFTAEGSFAVYRPGAREVELSALADDDATQQQEPTQR